MRFFRWSKWRKAETNKQPNGAKNHNSLMNYGILSTKLEVNLQKIKDILIDCGDVKYREFNVAQKESLKAAIIYLEGMYDKPQVDFQILKSLMLEMAMLKGEERLNRDNLLDKLYSQGITLQNLKKANTMQEVIEGVLIGNVVLLIDGFSIALINGVKNWAERAIEEPLSETVIRGPREGFVETLTTNLSLIRRRVKTPELKVVKFRLGRLTQTEIAVVYLRSIANPKIVAEVISRLERIEVDGILGAGSIEELIEDNPRSIFTQVKSTERPDKVCADLLEGRVAILIEGTPFVLVVPRMFIELIQAVDDYFERSYYATAIRTVRFFALIIALFLPAFYVGVVSFNQEMIPTPLLLHIAGEREGMPLPVLLETFILDIVFELLREAALRLPRQLGQSISIVGALIIGQGVVQAGLIAPLTVIIIALTAVSSFAIPNYAGATGFRLLRFLMLFLGGSLGLLGLICGIVITVIHMASLRSFGVPYLAPIAPTIVKDLKDFIYRAPKWAMLTRPEFIGAKDLFREAEGLKPGPAQKEKRAPIAGEQTKNSRKLRGKKRP